MSQYGSALSFVSSHVAPIFMCKSFPCFCHLCCYTEFLFLQENDLIGTVPSELVDLKMLDQFYLYGNNLTGPFTCPTTIEYCGISCEKGALPECRMLQ